jgi:hypothetical protein
MLRNEGKADTRYLPAVPQRITAPWPFASAGARASIHVRESDGAPRSGCLLSSADEFAWARYEPARDRASAGPEKDRKSNRKRCQATGKGVTTGKGETGKGVRNRKRCQEPEKVSGTDN